MCTIKSTHRKTDDRFNSSYTAFCFYNKWFIFSLYLFTVINGNPFTVINIKVINGNPCASEALDFNTKTKRLGGGVKEKKLGYHTNIKS